jgi:hypothetical protein
MNLIALNHGQRWLSKGEEMFTFYWEQDQHDFYKNRKRNSLVKKQELELLTSTRRSQSDLHFTKLREEQRRRTAE